MGNQIRTPKLQYFKNGVVVFYVSRKQIHYKVLLWLKDGLSQFALYDGIYKSDNQIKDLIKTTLQSFTNVKEIEN